MIAPSTPSSCLKTANLRHPRIRNFVLSKKLKKKGVEVDKIY